MVVLYIGNVFDVEHWTSRSTSVKKLHYCDSFSCLLFGSGTTKSPDLVLASLTQIQESVLCNIVLMEWTTKYAPQGLNQSICLLEVYSESETEN